MEQTEVCVVGAGPAGLALGLVLGQAGSPCVLLERFSAEAFQRRAGAGLIEYRTVRLLDADGLAEPILREGAATACVSSGSRVDPSLSITAS